MASKTLTAQNFDNMPAAVVAMDAAIDGASEAVDAALQCNVVKIGSANWGYWVIYTD